MSITGEELERAVVNDNAPVVERYLAAGGDPNAEVTTIDGMRLLHRAAFGGSSNTVSVLLAHGADRNANDSQGRIAMEWAYYGGHSNICAILGRSYHLQTTDDARREIVLRILDSCVALVTATQIRWSVTVDGQPVTSDAAGRQGRGTNGGVSSYRGSAGENAQRLNIVFGKWQGAEAVEVSYTLNGSVRGACIARRLYGVWVLTDEAWGDI